MSVSVLEVVTVEWRSALGVPFEVRLAVEDLLEAHLAMAATTTMSQPKSHGRHHDVNIHAVHMIVLQGSTPKHERLAHATTNQYDVHTCLMRNQ